MDPIKPGSAKPPQRSKISVRVVHLANRTTRVEIREGKRFFGDKPDKSQTQTHTSLNELAEEGIKLDIPPRTCSKGHRLELELEITLSTKTVRFMADGIVEKAEVFPRDHDSIVIQFTKHDANIWRQVLKEYRTLQSGVSALFKRLKEG